MGASDYVLWIGALVLYQVYATVLVANAKVYDRDQKIRQIIIIWLLPFVGAVLARMKLNAAENRPKPVDQAVVPTDPNADGKNRPTPGPDSPP